MLDVDERLTVFERDKVIVLPHSLGVFALRAVVRVGRVVRDGLASRLTIRSRIFDTIVLCLLLVFTEHVGVAKASRVTPCTAYAAASRSVPGGAGGHASLEAMVGGSGRK
jgi:hypothetical protein